MPVELLDAQVEVLLHIVVALVAVVVLHDALEQLCGISLLAHLLLAVAAHILQKLEVAVADHRGLEALGNLLAESLLVSAIALTEHLVEQLLVDLGGSEARDFRHLVAKVRLHLASLFGIVHLEQSLQLGIALVGLAGVEGEDVAQLAAFEDLLLVFGLDIFGHDECTLYGDTTFERIALGIELAEVALQKVVGLVGLSLLVVADTLSVSLHLLVDELVVYLYLVVFNLVFVGQLDLEFGSHSHVEDEGIGSLSLNVYGHLLVAGQRFAEHVDMIVVDVLVHFLSHHLVDDVHLHGGAILALDHPHGDHARTESRHLCALAIVFQLFLYFCLVVSLFHGERHQAVYLVRIFKCYFHFLSIFLYYY